MNLHRISKIQANKFYHGYYFTYDGAMSPRVKGEDKKKRRKAMRAYQKQYDLKDRMNYF